MVIMVITGMFGVGISLFVVMSFFQNKTVNNRKLKFDTIRYLEEKIHIISEGARWVQECTGEEVKENIQRIDITVSEYKKLDNDIFQKIQEQSKKYLYPLLVLSIALEQDVLNIDIIKAHKAQILIICNGFEQFILLTRNYTKDNNSYIEIDNLKKLLS